MELKKSQHSREKVEELTKKSREAIKAFIKNPTKSRLIAIYELAIRDGRASGPCMISNHCTLHHYATLGCELCPLGMPTHYKVTHFPTTTCRFSNLRENLRKPGAWEKNKARMLKALIEFQAGII